EAMTMGDRIAVMSNGLLQQVGSPQDLYNKPVNRFVAGVIGSPSMNFLDVDGVKDNGQTWLKKGDVALPPPDRLWAWLKGTNHLPAGIRHEHLEVGDVASSPAPLRASIDVVEFLGNEELLHARVGDKEIVAVVDSSHRIKPGDVLDVKVPLDHLQLFDDEGKSLAPAA